MLPHLKDSPIKIFFVWMNSIHESMTTIWSYSFCRNFFARKRGIRKFCPKIWWCGWKGRKKDPPATSPKHSLTFSLKTATRFYHKMNQFQNITEFCLDFCYILIEYIFDFDGKYLNKNFMKWIYLISRVFFYMDIGFFKNSCRMWRFHVIFIYFFW